jgi:hypothetical protein
MQNTFPSRSVNVYPSLFLLTKMGKTRVITTSLSLLLLLWLIHLFLSILFHFIQRFRRFRLLKSRWPQSAVSISRPPYIGWPYGRRQSLSTFVDKCWTKSKRDTHWDSTKFWLVDDVGDDPPLQTPTSLWRNQELISIWRQKKEALIVAAKWKDETKTQRNSWRRVLFKVVPHQTDQLVSFFFFFFSF